MTKHTNDQLDAFLYIGKIVYLTTAVLLAVFVIVVALISHDPSALIGLFFPIFMMVLGVAGKIASKSFDSGDRNAD